MYRAERSLLADALESIHYPSGRAIVREGTPGRTFFIIRSGKVRVTKGITNPDGTQSEELLTVLGQGDYFGERALLANIPRAATCTADGPVDCYYVHSVHFNLLLGHLKPTLLKLAGMDTDMTVTIGNTNDPIHLNNHPNTLRRGSLVDIPPMSRGETLLSTEVKGPTSASSSSPSSSSPSSSSSNEPLIPYNGLASTRLGRDPVAWRASLPPHLKGRGIQLDNFTIISEIGKYIHALSTTPFPCFHFYSCNRVLPPSYFCLSLTYLCFPFLSFLSFSCIRISIDSASSMWHRLSRR